LKYGRKYKHFFDEKEYILHSLRYNDEAGLYTLLTQIPDLGYPRIKINDQRKYIYVWGKGKDSENVIWQCQKNGCPLNKLPSLLMALSLFLVD